VVVAQDQTGEYLEFYKRQYEQRLAMRKRPCECPEPALHQIA